MKVDSDRAAVKHADIVEDMLAKHSKELEDAGLSVISVICCCTNAYPLYSVTQTKKNL